MQCFIFNHLFETLAEIEDYESFIWTDRYSSFGDFELVVRADSEVYRTIYPDSFVWTPGSRNIMIVEKIVYEQEPDQGALLAKISGRDATSLLARRIVWEPIDYKGTLQTIVRGMLMDNLIEPEDESRIIPGVSFVFDPDLDEGSLEVEALFHGDNLYEAVKTLCDQHGMGMMMNFRENRLEFSLYQGYDRSYRQDTFPYVIFEPHYDNVLSSTYTEDYEGYCNTVLVVGEAEEQNKPKPTVDVIYGDAIGYGRRETYEDASDIPRHIHKRVRDGVIESGPNKGKPRYKRVTHTIPIGEYNEALRLRGAKKLDEQPKIKTIDADIDPYMHYEYGRHFLCGDIVQITTHFGLSTAARITQFTRSMDETGYQSYPTFEFMESLQEW